MHLIAFPRENGSTKAHLRKAEERSQHTTKNIPHIFIHQVLVPGMILLLLVVVVIRGDVIYWAYR